MEMENNTPDTIKELPLNDYMHIFCYYTNISIEVWWLGGWCILKNCGVYDLSNPQVLTFIDAGASKSFPVRRCRLLLKPLLNISDEDKRELISLIHGNIGELVLQDVSPTIVAAVVDRVQSNLPIPLKAIDFLRERGYALPYKNWSVSELVKLGIFKLIEPCSHEYVTNVPDEPTMCIKCGHRWGVDKS